MRERERRKPLEDAQKHAKTSLWGVKRYEYVLMSDDYTPQAPGSPAGVDRNI